MKAAAIKFTITFIGISVIELLTLFVVTFLYILIFNTYLTFDNIIMFTHIALVAIVAPIIEELGKWVWFKKYGIKSAKKFTMTFSITEYLLYCLVSPGLWIVRTPALIMHNITIRFMSNRYGLIWAIGFHSSFNIIGGLL